MQDLTLKHCVPCESGVDPFTRQKAEEYLKAAENWELLEEEGKPLKIRRKFIFKDFKEALEFVNKVGALAESEGHHPNINLFDFKKVNITTYTHAINGLSENDFILAAKVNQLVL